MVMYAAEDVENEICYTGGIYDESTGLYYLDARYYDPQDGRFTSQDTYRGEDEEYKTWNLYTYCADNPVGYVDPSGHSTMALFTAAARAYEAGKALLGAIALLATTYYTGQAVRNAPIVTRVPVYRPIPKPPVIRKPRVQPVPKAPAVPNTRVLPTPKAPEVTLLEKEERWMDACKLLYQKWKQNNKRLEYTLRLLWECWYFDLEDACFIYFSEEETQAVHQIFREVYSHSERHFRNESKYLWLTAYMLEICGTLMYDITIYDERLVTLNLHILKMADEEAKYRFQKVKEPALRELMARGWDNASLSEDDIKKGKLLFMKRKLTQEETEEKKRIEEKIEKFKEKVEKYFPGNSMVDEYFREMYSFIVI